jgi:hypothetical protein
MRTAPAVHLSLKADTPWRVGLCLLCAVAAAVPAAWAALWLHAPPLGALGAAAAAALPAAVLPWRRVVSDATVLAWDGAQWRLSLRSLAQPVEGRAQLMIDLGPWLLLRFTPVDAGLHGRWLALSQSRYRPHWHALRCALHAVPLRGGPQRG